MLEPNEYIAYSCGCATGPSETIWEDVLIKGVPDDDDDRFGRKLTPTWCTIHGPEFCSAILAGDSMGEPTQTRRSRGSSATTPRGPNDY